MCDGAVAGFKYFDLEDTKEIRVNIRGNAEGIVIIKDGDTENAAVMRLSITAKIPVIPA